MGQHTTKWDRFLVWFSAVAFASFSLGIALQQILLGLYAIFTSVTSLVRGGRPGYLLARERLPMVALLAASIFSGIAAHSRFPSPEGIDFQWAMLAYWVIAPALAADFDWKRQHRVLLILSVPPMISSIFWLLQPDEIAHAMNVGFTMFPRAQGFQSNPITYSEGLVVLAAWSLARLAWPTGKLESRLIRAHLVISVLLVVFSRVRTGLVGFAVLFLIHGLLEPRYRKACLIALTVMILLFSAGTLVFGFNMASIEERLVLIQANLNLITQSPVYGIGPDKYSHLLQNGVQLPEHPHNTLIGVTTESGFIGLACYLVVVFVLGRQLWSIMRAHWDREDPLAWPTRALFYVFVHFNLHGLFDFNYNDTESLLMHALHWGLITELVRRLSAKTPLPDTDNRDIVR